MLNFLKDLPKPNITKGYYLFFRLSCQYCRSSNVTNIGVPIYEDYKIECSKRGINPGKSRIGSFVSKVFPGVSSYVTRNLRYQKCVLSVSGVVYRRNEICYDPTNLIDAIEPFLTEDMSIAKIPNGGVKIICPTRHVCHISQLSFNIILSRQLEVSLFLETKPIDPTSFGIYERLPRFSSHTIPGLLLSIQSLQLCIGEQSTSKLQRQGLMYFNYRNVNSTVELLHCRAPNCDLLLPPAKVDDICDQCRYVLRYKPTCERKQRKIVKLVDTGTATEPVVNIETLIQQLFPNIVGHDD